MRKLLIAVILLFGLFALVGGVRQGPYNDPHFWSANSVKGVADNGYIDLQESFGLPPDVSWVSFVIQAHAPANLLYGVGKSLELINWSRRTNWNDEWHVTQGETAVSDGQLYVAFEGDVHYILYIVDYAR